MGIYAYKAFAPGLKCRGYQYKEHGVNEFDHATCVSCGAHCAENPLDCLDYYSSFEDNEFYLVYASGDVHEDGRDSKIACTRLEILRRLSLEDFVGAALDYILDHPKRKRNHRVYENRGAVTQNHFVIVEGPEPIAKAKEVGDILGFVIDAGGTAAYTKEITVDGNYFLPGKWYTSLGKEVRNPDEDDDESGAAEEI